MYRVHQFINHYLRISAIFVDCVIDWLFQTSRVQTFQPIICVDGADESGVRIVPEPASRDLSHVRQEMFKNPATSLNERSSPLFNRYTYCTGRFEAICLAKKKSVRKVRLGFAMIFVFVS